MKFSAIIAAAGLAALSNAAPLEDRATQGTFQVVNFSWGCTVGCSWLFNVTIPFSGPNHRPVTQPSQCQGTRGSQEGYVDCTSSGVRAYIGADDSTGAATLFLQYQDTYPKKGSYYIYSGNTTVYSQTGDHAAQQAKNFNVLETSAVGVA